jgi:hypothetical protein
VRFNEQAIEAILFEQVGQRPKYFEAGTDVLLQVHFL